MSILAGVFSRNYVYPSQFKMPFSCCWVTLIQFALTYTHGSVPEYLSLGSDCEGVMLATQVPNPAYLIYDYVTKLSAKDSSTEGFTKLDIALEALDLAAAQYKVCLLESLLVVMLEHK